METICCDPSSEPSGRDGSHEGSQHVFMQNKQILSLITPNTPSYLELWKLLKNYQSISDHVSSSVELLNYKSVNDLGTDNISALE